MSWRAKRVNPAVEGAEVQEPSGGESEWLERGDHPLLNDLILDTLFGFVRRRELKACRVVSTNWNRRTIPHMRANFRVTIRGNESWKSVTTFVNLFSSNKLGIPFAKFSLGPFCTRDGVGQQFLQLCGEIASEIDMDEEPLEEYTIEDASELLRSCPNLKVLGFPSHIISRSESVVKLFPDSAPLFPSLKTITFHRGSDALQKCCPSAIEELLTVAPHISDIIVSDIPKHRAAEDGDEVGSKISCVLNCIEKLGRESSIQSLDLGYGTLRHIEHLQRLTKKEKGLKLKSLTFTPNLKSQEVFDGVEIQLAVVFKEILQSLHVELVAEKSLMAFPFMPHLKSLTFTALSNPHPEPVNLTQNFPSLERLDIIYLADADRQSDFFSQFDSSSTIKSLCLQGRKTTFQTLNKISRVFPNLTELSLIVANDREEILRQIWSQMTGLESLSISIHTGGTEKKSLDSFFTGIPPQTLGEIRPLVTGYGFDILTVQQKTETILKLTEQHSGLPSIRDLTKLRHLDLNVRGVSHLSDLTAYLAFYSMNHIRHIVVESCLFTKTSCEILTKETGLESWRFLTTEGRDIIPPFVLPERENDYD